MQNQPLNEIFSGDDVVIGPAASKRFWAMSAAFVAGLCVVLCRAGWIQSELQASYLESLQTTTTEYEVIPARDGRIMTENVILAADVDLYSIEVHYRWLQQQADPGWIRRHVRSQLTRQERADSQLVEQVTAELIRDRDQMWSRLSQLTNTPEAEIQSRRESIELRIQRIADSVNRRHHSELSEHLDEDLLTVDHDQGFLMQVAADIRFALTTPPHRQSSERIIVREEEDFQYCFRMQICRQRLKSWNTRICTQESRFVREPVGAIRPKAWRVIL